VRNVGSVGLPMLVTSGNGVQLRKANSEGNLFSKKSPGSCRALPVNLTRPHAPPKDGDGAGCGSGGCSVNVYRCMGTHSPSEAGTPYATYFDV
jgi:hypothetical protein